MVAVLWGGRFSVPAALPPAQFNQSTAQIAGALTRFFSDTRTFTATTVLTVQRAADPDSRVVLHFGSAFDGGKMRLDLNLKSQLNASLGTGLPELGIDRVNFMLYPEHPARVVFPSQQAYLELPLEQAVSPRLKEQADAAASRIEKKFIRNETVAGVPARMYQLHPDGAAQTAWLWEAPRMNDLPVQVRVTTGGYIYNFAFRNVRQGPVDPRVFGIPATFKKVSGPEAIVQIAAGKITEQLNAALPR